MDKNEEVRQRLIAVRREFAARLAQRPPVRDRAVFHRGVWKSGSVETFITYLRRNPGFTGAQTLDKLPAGEYLTEVTHELVKDLAGELGSAENVLTEKRPAVLCIDQRSVAPLIRTLREGVLRTRAWANLA